ncbi:DUF397 domain-containing protein [Nonomuraea sp. NPDC049649]|uniref:DUF397 domain-containing protein n=1 Tax=Nonomuraea sp. NPDC049649 TaxID=3155776 RepID=UPI0034435AC5
MSNGWKRSSFCNHNGNCVEVRAMDARTVAIRDSKRPDQAPLVISASDYSDFIQSIRNGDVQR